MEKSLVDNKPLDPNAEPCENYENLPFHGMQNPPTKVKLSFSFLFFCYFCLHYILTLIAVVTFPVCCCYVLSLYLFLLPSACFDYCFRAFFCPFFPLQSQSYQPISFLSARASTDISLLLLLPLLLCRVHSPTLRLPSIDFNPIVFRDCFPKCLENCFFIVSFPFESWFLCICVCAHRYGFSSCLNVESAFFVFLWQND